MSDLYDKLAEAYARPSGAYRTFQTAAEIPQRALEGYLAGGQISDQMRKRKNAQMTLRDALGGNLPEGLGGFGDTTVERAGELAKPIEAIAVLDKTNTPSKDYLTLDQATKQLLGIKGGKLTPQDTDYLNSFGGKSIPRQDLTSYVTGQTGKQNADTKGDFFGTKSGQIRLDQLPSNMVPNTAAGAGYQVKLAARMGKSLIAKATTPQNLTLAGSDLARAVQRSAPYASTIGESDYANSLPTLFGRLKQKLDSDPNSPDVPKLRKQLYDTFDHLDKAATPFIENHLNNYGEMFGQLPDTVRQREMGNTLPDIPFVDTAPAAAGKTYQKTAVNAQGVKIGTNDNWSTWEPVQ